MELHELIQGSPEWLAYRRSMRNASDSAAMMGVSPHKTRSQLLHEVWLGMQPEVSEYQQTVVLDPGHQFERLALPLAEEIVGESLYPVVGSLEGTNLSASFDGLNFSETLHFEHKRLSNVLRECMPCWGENENVSLPLYHQIQVNQQFMVAKTSEACLFMASEWTDEGKLIEERHCWAYPDKALQSRIEAGWRQFDADLAVYKPAKAEPAKLVGASMSSLPALRVLVHGEVTDTNVEEWATIARAVLGSINRTLNTDQDFADAKEAVKWCERQEASLKAAKEHALSQTESIDKLFKTIDAIMAETAAIRLEQDKLVKRREGERKTELVGESVAAFHAFVAELNEGLAPYRLPTIAADFPAQIKGKRSFSSMKDALDTELARAKIEATNTANAMRVNIRKLETQAADFMFLFNDARDLIQKDSEAAEAIIGGRITTHLAEVERKANAERERIRAEEQAKAEAAAFVKAVEILRQEREAQEARDHAAKVDADRVEAEAAAERRRQDEEARREREQAEADLQKLGQAGAPVADEPTPSQRHAETIYSNTSVLDALPGIRPGDTSSQILDKIQSAVADVAATLAADEPATVSLGKIAECLGFRLDEAFIVEKLGIPWRKKDKSARLWSAGDYNLIRAALIKHLRDDFATGYVPF